MISAKNLLVGTIALVMLVAQSGCEAIWNAANRDAAQADIRQFLGKYQIDPQELRCNMVGTTRDAVCEFKADKDRMAYFPDKVKLSSFIPNGPGEMEHILEICPRFHAVYKDMKETSFYRSTQRRSPVLKFENGGQMEFLNLYWNYETNDICLHFSYAYG